MLLEAGFACEMAGRGSQAFLDVGDSLQVDERRLGIAAFQRDAAKLETRFVVMGVISEQVCEDAFGSGEFAGFDEGIGDSNGRYWGGGRARWSDVSL